MVLPLKTSGSTWDSFPEQGWFLFRVETSYEGCTLHLGVQMTTDVGAFDCRR